MRKDIVDYSIIFVNRKEIFRANNKLILIFMALIAIIILSGCVEENNKKLTIISSIAGAQTNYPMKLSVYNSTGTDVSGVVYLGGRVRSDFGDLRFTKSDKITPLDYWIESYTPGVSAVVWVNIDLIPANPGKTDIYLYYGNFSETSASNGKATFTFFDDFNNLDYWVNDISTNYDERLSSSVSNGEVTISTRVSNSNPNGSYAIKRTIVSFYPNVAIRTRSRDISTYYPGGFGFGTYSFILPNLTGDNTVQKGLASYRKFWGLSVKNGTMKYILYSSDDAYYIWDLIWTPSEIELLRNGVSLWSNNDTSTIPNVPLNLGIGNMGEFSGGQSNSDMIADWILVRNCVNPEPTWA